MNALRTADKFKAEFLSRQRRALILTTVVHESRSVNAHLSDEEYILGSHDVIYTVGNFSDPSGDWLVVHAICQAGNVDAAVTASKAYKDFGAFNVQMFVGVAGSLKEDLPVGSVVVGNYVYNAHSAKTDDEGSYSRPHGLPAGPELLQAATILIIDESWTRMIRPPKLGRFPTIDDYPCGYPPIAQVKAIASGEEVVAGGQTPLYQSIRRHLSDAAAIEMEGWGAMGAAHSERTSAIVIRGISDMCAGKEHASDARCQPVASAHAAAFAFAILSIRSRAMPSPPAVDELQPLVVDSMTNAEPRSEFVLNLRGSLEEWPKERIDIIIGRMQVAIGDKDLTLIRVEKGSVRLIFEVRDKDLPKLGIEEARNALGDLQHDLLGALTVDELGIAQEAKAALEKASINLLSWERTLPDGGWLDRPELSTINTDFKKTKSSTVLLGDPGSGKSALLSNVALALVNQGVPVLAIKADLLSPSLRTEEDLQAELALPDLPGILLLKLARYQPVFLIIDQLDALASQVDLRSDRLNILLNLVRQIGDLPNVHILLSARTFEFNHDVRLRSVNAEALSLSLPAWHLVLEKLAAAGLNAGTWAASAREVIRSPQALKTYLALNNKNDEAPFSKYQSMLESLWLQKIVAAPDAEALALLASDLAGKMAEEETLWLAASRFDERLKTLSQLESSGLIVRSDNQKSVAFSHQTIFEYVLARSFVKSAGRLSTYVLERQDSLFVRPKLWSALRYLRDVEATSYEREFLQIWGRRDLRLHLRLLLVEFLGEQRDPTAAEKKCLDETILSKNLRLATLKSISGSQGWFDHFAFSALSSAMKGSDVERNLSLTTLQRAWPFDSAKVVRLIRENWLDEPTYDEYTWAAITNMENWPQDIQTIASTVLARSHIGNWAVDHAASVLAVHQPDAACRLVREKLAFSFKKARELPFGRPYPDDGTLPEKMSWHISDSPKKAMEHLLESSEWPSMPAIAQEQPQIFLKELWPWFHSIFGELLQREHSTEWNYRFPGTYGLDLGLPGDTSSRFAEQRPLLFSLRVVIEALAVNDHGCFEDWVDANQSIDFAPVQRLIAYGFTFAPQHYATKILDWLCADTRRFHLGGSNDVEKTAIELVRATSHFWTDDQITRLEHQVLNYKITVPKDSATPELRRHFNQYGNDCRTRLLAAIPVQKLSAVGQAVVAADKGHDVGRHELHVAKNANTIGSPMSSSHMQKAKDRDIIKLFHELPDSTNWDHPSGWMRGGNIQLSRAFAEFAKKEPARALRIVEQFEPGAQERAAAYALETLADSGEHDSEIQDSIRDLCLRGFGSQEFTSSIAHAIEKIARRPAVVDPTIVDIMIGWLCQSNEDTTLENEVTVDDVGKEDTKESRGSVLWGMGGISVLPGGNFPTLSALATILLNDGERGRDRLIDILNGHLLLEGNVKIWQALLTRLGNAGGSTPEVVSKFVRSLFYRYPHLLETHEAIHFLAYAQRWDDELVYELIAPWAFSDKPMIRQAYGELIGLTSIVRDSSAWTAARELLLERGAEETKVGLAYAGVNLWNEESWHRQACKLLTALVISANTARMRAILDVFRICNELFPEPETLEFLRALASNGVDLVNAPSDFIVERLQSLLPHAADLVAAIAMKLVEGWRRDLTSMRSATPLVAPQLTDLSITLHRLGGSSRSAGVHIFEALLDIDAYGTRDILTEIDGRIGNQARVFQKITRRVSKRTHPRTN